MSQEDEKTEERRKRHGYGNSHGVPIGMGMGTVMNPRDITAQGRS